MKLEEKFLVRLYALENFGGCSQVNPVLDPVLFKPIMFIWKKQWSRWNQVSPLPILMALDERISEYGLFKLKLFSVPHNVMQIYGKVTVKRQR